MHAGYRLATSSLHWTRTVDTPVCIAVGTYQSSSKQRHTWRSGIMHCNIIIQGLWQGYPYGPTNRGGRVGQECLVGATAQPFLGGGGERGQRASAGRVSGITTLNAVYLGHLPPRPGSPRCRLVPLSSSRIPDTAARYLWPSISL